MILSAFSSVYSTVYAISVTLDFFYYSKKKLELSLKLL